MTDAPLDIRRFETLQLVYVALSLVYGFAAAPDWLITRIIGAVLMLTLTLLVSRGRRNWARWALLILFVLWILGLAILLGFALANRNALPVVPTASYPFAVVIAGLLQGTGLFLIFTPESSSWLRSARSKA